jgi:hypothetical protein
VHDLTWHSAVWAADLLEKPFSFDNKVEVKSKASNGAVREIPRAILCNVCACGRCCIAQSGVAACW